MLTLNEVLPFFGNRKAQLAEALGISRQAISNWSENQAIPEKHELKIRHELVPQISLGSHDSTPSTSSNLPNNASRVEFLK